MKKLISLILAFLMIVSVFTLSACGEAEATRPTNVFRDTTIELPEELTGSNVNFNQYYHAGDKVYIQVYSYDLETYMPSYFIAAYDLASGAFDATIPLEFEQSENGGANLSNFTVAADGTIYMMVEVYTYSETSYEQKNELRVIRDGVTETMELDLLVDDNYGFYVQSMVALDDGSLLLASWNAMRIVTPDGEVKKVENIDPDNTNIENVFMMDGKLYVQIYTYSEDSYGSKLMEFDHTTGEFGAESEINAEHAYNMIFGPGYDYYYNDRNVLWGVDSETGEMTEVVNFINSDINGNDVRTIIPISEDRFFLSCRERNTATGNSTNRLSFIDRVPDEEVVPKKMLRMAVNYANYDLRSRVIEFNKASDTYRITIDDYSRYNTDENYSAGIEKLNSDIIAGNVPDIFMINEETPYDVYASKGIFADLYELMDADESFDRSKYLENIFKAYEYDGELLSLIPSFTIQTFAAKKELLDGMTSWTFEEFAEFADAHPDMQMFDYEFNRSYFIQMFMLFARGQFINSETGECSFDSPEFRQLLSFAASLSEDDFWSSLDEEDQMSGDFWTEYDNRFKEGRVLLSSAYISDFEYSIKNLLNYTFGAEPTFIGFPVSEGNGALISAYSEYAVSADSDFKEGAWQFLKTLISEDAQMPVYNEEYQYWNYPAGNLPIYIPALEKMAEIAMTPRDDSNSSVVIGGIARPAIAYASSSSVVVAADTAAVVEVETEAVDTEIADEPTETDDTEVTDDTESVETAEVSEKIAVDTPAVLPGVDWTDPYATPLTQAQADELMALVKGVTQVARYDEDLNNIINEELEPFFAGTQSLDDTVMYIQDRVSKYINESR